MSWFSRKPTPHTPAKVRLPEIVPSSLPELRKEDREKLRGWLASADTQFAFALLAARKPTLFVQGIHAPNTDALTRRALQLIGWESCLNTLRTLHLTAEEKKQIVETFPDPELNDN